MIDLHSHVLPGVDDGSKSVEESLRMLVASAGQGIAYMAATPHFYPSETGPEQFLDRRNQAAERLWAECRPEYPKLLLGAEVYYCDGISQAGEIEALRIEGTSLLLMEMPFQTWSDRMVAEIRALHNRPGCTVVLAHIERYLRYQKKTAWDKLLEAGILMQSNASFFLQWTQNIKLYICLTPDGYICWVQTAITWRNVLRAWGRPLRRSGTGGSGCWNAGAGCCWSRRRRPFEKEILGGRCRGGRFMRCVRGASALAERKSGDRAGKSGCGERRAV